MMNFINRFVGENIEKQDNHRNDHGKGKEPVTRGNDRYVNDQPVRFQYRNQWRDLRIERGTTMSKAHHNYGNHESGCRN